jgi:eukaryotic-like serine/threonine-protein kinase
MSEPAGDAGESIDIGVKAGDVLAGKYRVERVLGVGGMGVVVAAHHIQLDEKVALKFLLPHALSNAEAMARFEREARAAVKIKSEHVARVSDVGKLESGSPYMVMEYLHGSDLAAVLQKRGALPIDESVEYVLQACEAIAEAHALGIIHRDLKPANLFCIRRADGRMSVKVLDFGISKLTNTAGTDDKNMTRTTAIMGSPLYMSPEQMQASKNVDARSDVWALGVILFELVCGKPPFDAEVVTELVIKIATQPPASIRSLRTEVPPGLEQIIMRCLEKDAGKRYRNVGELALALESFAPKRARSSIDRILGTMESAGISMAPPAADATGGADGGAPMPGSGTVAAWGAQTGSETRKSKAGLVGALAAAAVLSIGAGAFVLTRHPQSAPAAAAQPAPSPPAPPPAAAAPPPVPAAAAAPAPAAPPTPAASQAAPTPPSAPAPAKAASAPAGRHESAPHAAPAAAPAHPAAKVDCNPPYYYDANGTRVFKKECI